MSENDNCHCAGTTKVAVSSHGMKRVKQKAFDNQQSRSSYTWMTSEALFDRQFDRWPCPFWPFMMQSMQTQRQNITATKRRSVLYKTITLASVCTASMMGFQTKFVSKLISVITNNLL